MSSATATAAPAPRPAAELRRVLGQAGQYSAEKRARGCVRPVRLVGSTAVVNPDTGQVGHSYGSGDELDGYTYVRCRNRRAAVCPSCSREYKGDAWHVVMCGLAGGKGVPESVADHSCTFATLTAPSFGAVHGLRSRGPCRARRDKPLCPHGRPAWCTKRHDEDDPQLGQPQCADCYDYTGHIVWQWHAPELWRRFCIALQRDLARRCGLSVAKFRRRCKIAYAKVVEFQARGVIHVHVPIRLDDPRGADGPPPDVPLSTSDLEDGIRAAATKVRLDTPALPDGTAYQLRWGSQVDTRTITDTAAREGHSPVAAHPEQVAAYTAKYLTKTTDDFGLPTRVFSAKHAARAGASPHAVRLIETAEWLAATDSATYARLPANLTTLGYRGHPITKSHKYSVTFGQIRRARRVHRANPAALDPEADFRELLDDVDDDLPEGFERISVWQFAGVGYLDLPTAAAAVEEAARSRCR